MIFPIGSRYTVLSYRNFGQCTIVPDSDSKKIIQNYIPWCLSEHPALMMKSNVGVLILRTNKCHFEDVRQQFRFRVLYNFLERNWEKYKTEVMMRGHWSLPIGLMGENYFNKRRASVRFLMSDEGIFEILVHRLVCKGWQAHKPMLNHLWTPSYTGDMNYFFDLNHSWTLPK